MLTRTGILALIAFAFGATTSAQYSQPVRDVENPGHFPFSASAQHSMSAPESSRFGLPLATVPAGKRVVLEYVAVACQTYGTDSIADFRIQIPRVIDGYNNTIPVPLPVSRQGDLVSGSQRWVGGGPVKLYADYSTAYSIYWGFSRTSTLNSANCQVYVFGHTINTP